MYCYRYKSWHYMYGKAAIDRGVVIAVNKRLKSNVQAANLE